MHVDTALPAALAAFNCDLNFEATGWSAQAVLAEMGDTFVSWPTSPFTTAAMQVAQLAPDQAFDNLVLLCIMGSGLFATQYLNSTACTLRASARDKMAALLKFRRAHPATLVGRSTRAGRVLHRRIAPAGQNWRQSGPYFTPFRWVWSVRVSKLAKGGNHQQDFPIMFSWTK